MVMILYGTITASVQRAILPLVEAGVDIDNVLELKFVDLLKGAHKRPEYLAKQPFGQVPCLQDGDFILYESRAIARYFAEIYGHGQLLGKTPKERATINQWVDVESQNFTTAVGVMVREVFVSFMQNKPRDETIVAAGAEKVKPVFDVYEAQLSKHKYIAGDEYSLADVCHIPHLNILMRVKEQIFTAEHRHVRAWAEALVARPALQKVMELNPLWLKQSV